MVERMKVSQQNLKDLQKCRKPLDFGLRGEELPSEIRSSERHTDGAREARKAQQF